MNEFARAIAPFVVAACIVMALTACTIHLVTIQVQPKTTTQPAEKDVVGAMLGAIEDERAR